MKPKNQAFTLIELLVVISIIMVLAGLLMPALSAARQSARTSEDRNNMWILSTAIAAYRNEYGAYPVPTGCDGNPFTTAQLKEFYKICNGEDTAQNQRTINYISSIPLKFFKDGVLVDCWGNPIQVSLDFDYDHNVVYFKDVAPIGGEFAAYSWGKKGSAVADGKKPENVNLWVKSWKS